MKSAGTSVYSEAETNPFFRYAIGFSQPYIISIKFMYAMDEYHFGDLNSIWPSHINAFCQIVSIICTECRKHRLIKGRIGILAKSNNNVR